MMAHTASETFRRLEPRPGYRPPFADDGAASWQGPAMTVRLVDRDEAAAIVADTPESWAELSPSELFWGAGA
jgi:hypothetical protein